MIWYVAEKKAVSKIIIDLSLGISQRMGTTDRDSLTREVADLANYKEEGGRVVKKIESFSEMPTNTEKQRYQLCYGIFVSGVLMKK